MHIVHGQASLVDLQSCLHCSSMPEKVLERRLRVAVGNSENPCLAATAPMPAVHQARASTSWADMMDAESTIMPLLFNDLDHGELGNEDAECDAKSDLLDMVDMKEGRTPCFLHHQSRPSSAADAVPPTDSDLHI